ncbi:Protocadherin-9 [Pitangus sulphuratus]|nr:Protocadherin-9 [Pitangus sulphuratus]
MQSIKIGQELEQLNLPKEKEGLFNKCDLYEMTPQRRVTFHLPDGSQESCSDSGLGDHEPTSGASTSHPLPLGFPQEEYYEQASPNSRTEGDGNSDPESSK